MCVVAMYRVRGARRVLHCDHHTLFVGKVRQLFRHEVLYVCLLCYQRGGHETCQRQNEFCERHGLLWILPTLRQEASFLHFCWATNIINSAKSTIIVLTCARTSASIAVRSPIISILSLVPSLPVVVSAAIVLGSGFPFT